MVLTNGIGIIGTDYWYNGASTGIMVLTNGI